MAAKISSPVAATVCLVALVVGSLVAVLALAQRPSPFSGPSGPEAAAPPLPSRPTATPADRGTPRPVPTTPAAPEPTLRSATATVCVDRNEHHRLRFLTFNIHSARAHDGSVHLAAIAGELARWHADVVALQEVDRGRRWTRRLDMPRLLASSLGTTWTFGANVNRSPTNQYGTAILSRFPIVSSSNTALPAPPGTQQRGLLHAVLDVGGVEVSVYDTHLESTSWAAREQQMRTIVPVLRSDPRPKLLGGDLNAVPSSPVLTTARTVMGDTWESVGRGPGYTSPAGHPSKRIDQQLYADGSGIRLVPTAARVLPSSVSDHRAVLATYRIIDAGQQVCVPDL